MSLSKLVLSAAACAVFASVSSAQWNPAVGQWGKVDPADLRVMTYNVQDGICSTNAKVEGNNNWCALARVVACFKPDVLILEEVGDNSGNGTGSNVDSVATLTTTINQFLHGGLDTFHANTPITAWVQKYAPSYDLPYVYVSTDTDGFNRNVLLSRHPFSDLNGDGKSTQANIPNVTATGYAPGGDGGIRGFLFCEINLPDATYTGNVVVGGAHLKSGGTTADHNDRVAAAQNVAYAMRYWFNGNGGATPDPQAKVADSPAATSVLAANTPIVIGGDWNEDELANGATRGPADWLTAAQTVGGATDGTDRDGTDMTLDGALNFFTGSDASHSSGDKYDYLGFQDSIATLRLATIYIAGSTPGAAQPPEAVGFTGGAAGLTTAASDHRPVFVDLRLPIVDCNGNGVADTTDIALGTVADTNANQIPDVCECSVANECVATPNSAGAGAFMSHLGSLSISNNDFVLDVLGAVPNTQGLFFYSQTAANVPFGNGIRCVGGSITRLPVVVADLFGTASYPLNFPALGGTGVITPGTTWRFQFWFRDAVAGGAFFDLSDALRVQFCP